MYESRDFETQGAMIGATWGEQVLVKEERHLSKIFGCRACGDGALAFKK